MLIKVLMPEDKRKNPQEVRGRSQVGVGVVI